MPTTIKTSAIPALKSELVDVLKQRGGLQGVQVTYGMPAGQPQQEWVMVADVPDWSQEYIALARGRYPKDERFTLRIYVSVRRGRGSQQLATERAFELAAEVEDAIRDDPGIGSTVDAAGVAGSSLLEIPSDNATEARLELAVECRVRI